MATERNVVDFKIHNLTEEQFQELKAQGKIDPNAVYCTPDTTKERLDALETKTTSLEENKQDIATAVNYDNITNCITEIPQDIKLELNNGTLTLKAGSKVYVPNGAGVFDVVNITNDISNSGNAMKSVAITDGSSLLWTNNVSSGGTAPANPSNGQIWYDTTNNVVKRYSTGSGTWIGGFSLPIALLNTNATTLTTITEMQVFNGFGYIGSTVFVLPMVKGLMPDGRNADGTLKNRNMTIQNVITKTIPSNTGWHYFVINPTGTGGDFATEFYIGAERPSNPTTYSRYYNLTDNRIYTIVSGAYTAGTMAVIPIRIEHSSSSPYTITSWHTPTVFHAVDYGDTEYIAHQAMPSDRYVDLTLPDDGGNITSPADGYFYLSKNSTATGQRVRLYNYTNTMCVVSWSSGTQNLEVCLPVSKGDVVRTVYSADGTTNVFRFIYANGAK